MLPPFQLACLSVEVCHLDRYTSRSGSRAARRQASCAHRNAGALQAGSVLSLQGPVQSGPSNGKQTLHLVPSLPILSNSGVGCHARFDDLHDLSRLLGQILWGECNDKHHSTIPGMQQSYNLMRLMSCCASSTITSAHAQHWLSILSPHTAITAILY